MLIGVRERQQKSDRCPLCHEGLHAGEIARCDACATVYHRECLDEFSGCSTLGCPEQGVPPRPCAYCSRPADAPEAGRLLNCAYCRTRRHRNCRSAESECRRCRVQPERGLSIEESRARLNWLLFAIPPAVAVLLWILNLKVLAMVVFVCWGFALQVVLHSQENR